MFESVNAVDLLSVFMMILVVCAFLPFGCLLYYIDICESRDGRKTRCGFRARRKEKIKMMVAGVVIYFIFVRGVCTSGTILYVYWYNIICECTGTILYVVVSCISLIILTNNGNDLEA